MFAQLFLKVFKLKLNWIFLFPCFRFRYYSRSRIYYKVQYRGKWGPKNVANPCGFTFIGTHVLVLPCISMEDEQTTVKQNIAKIVPTFKLQIFHRKRNTENKRALTKILVFCLVFSGAGSLFKIFLFLLQRFFTSIKKGKICLGAWYYSCVWIQNLWLNCHTCAVVGIAIACIAIISSF